MAFLNSLPVRYHQQDETLGCGQACIQMVLDAIGAGLATQASIATELSHWPSLESIWATAPNSLQNALFALRPSTFSSPVVLCQNSDRELLTRSIIWSIHHYHLPAIVLTGGMAHWVVVSGFNTSVAPSSAIDTSYQIKALDFHSPSLVPGPPPPPHASTDQCGSGGNRGLAIEHASFSEWIAFYLPAPVGSSSHWAGSYLSVCAAPPSSVDSHPIVGVQSISDSPKANGENIIDLETARRLAIDSLREFGLFQRVDWAPFLVDAVAGIPILVQRIDRHDSFYYIVPVKSGSAAPVVVKLDARFGNYHQSGRTRHRQEDALRGLHFDHNWANSQLVVNSLFQNVARSFKLRKEVISLYPTLVWRPCRESNSPYIPFFMFNISGKTIYLRVDGKVFSRLHFDDRGN